MYPVKFHDEPKSVLGEAPVWNALSETLYWVDCDRKRMFHLSPDNGEIGSIEMPHHPGSYAFCGSGQIIMAYRNQLALVDLTTGRAAPIATEINFSIERFNDGACDRAGRFWVGTMDRSMKDPVGALYRVDPDLSIRKMASDVVVSNGIAFSPDDTVMYHTDSRSALIYAYDFDFAAGEIGERRIFADFRGRSGRPDGCTTDADGNLWIAENNAGQVVCLAPDGREVRTVSLPTARPTSLCFGGRNFKTLFVTSMQHMLTPDQLAEQPSAGCLFELDVGATGLPEPLFGGDAAGAVSKQR